MAQAIEQPGEMFGTDLARQPRAEPAPCRTDAEQADAQQAGAGEGDGGGQAGHGPADRRQGGGRVSADAVLPP
ncbi:hypothetical protein QWJ26_15210 [Streptomyces sp. CSDS2]|uniref:hypothetical protein n=1 Tax=Streptomyces sp. CSDS2 TaxID=3055051 RepID=UPI0025AF5E6B|nr:hypothetical protein [Streptomyces sp. CSDS2]MDN3261140.1 hypothetical protein [Streptomyces sp. CSDS2]